MPASQAIDGKYFTYYNSSKGNSVSTRQWWKANIDGTATNKNFISTINIYPRQDDSYQYV